MCVCECVCASHGPHSKKVFPFLSFLCFLFFLMKSTVNGAMQFAEGALQQVRNTHTHFHHRTEIHSVLVGGLISRYSNLQRSHFSLGPHRNNNVLSINLCFSMIPEQMAHHMFDMVSSFIWYDFIWPRFNDPKSVLMTPKAQSWISREWRRPAPKTNR